MRDLEGYTEWDEPRKASRTEYNISMVEAIRQNGRCTLKTEYRTAKWDFISYVKFLILIKIYNFTKRIIEVQQWTTVKW